MPGALRTQAATIYKHIQSTPATTWTINHKINTKYVIVDCFIDLNSTVVQVIPLSVSSTVAGTTVVTWTEPQSGYALAV